MYNQVTHQGPRRRESKPFSLPFYEKWAGRSPSRAGKTLDRQPHSTICEVALLKMSHSKLPKDRARYKPLRELLTPRNRRRQPDLEGVVADTLSAPPPLPQIRE